MKQNLPSTESKIDLTPMLDVVFIMLIFFIVTANFVREVGIDLTPPEPDRPPPDEPASELIMVKITSASRLVLGDLEIDVRAISAHLQRLHAQNPDAPLVIKPHAQATTDVIVRVIDAARLVGIDNIGFATQPGKHTS